jgi:hypothetical protein
MKHTILILIGLSLTYFVSGQSATLPKMSSDDSSFVENVVRNMKPLSYTATPTHHGIVLVMVYKDYTLIETLVDGFVEDLVELTPKEAIVYPRELD